MKLKRLCIGFLIFVSCTPDNPFSLEKDERIVGNPNQIVTDFGSFKNTFIYSKGLLVKTITEVNNQKRDSSIITYRFSGDTVKAYTNGQLWKTRLQNGRETSVYDSNGKVISTEYQVADGIVSVTSSTYSFNSNIRSVTRDTVTYHKAFESHKVYSTLFEGQQVVNSEKRLDTLYFLEYDFKGNVITQFFKGGDTIKKLYIYSD